MTVKFNRKIRLEISDLTISELRIKFNIEKSLVGYPNKATIEIYNLSEASRSKIEEDDLELSLFAGYEEHPLIFKGEIINVIHLKDKTEWITTIYAGDATKTLNSATINKTLTAGTTVTQIYNELTKSMSNVTKGITEGLTKCLSGKKSILRSLQLTGNVKDLLKKLAED